MKSFSVLVLIVLDDASGKIFIALLAGIDLLIIKNVKLF